MKQKIRRTSRLLDDTIREACERIPQKKRKTVVLGLCFLFVAIFFVMLWDTFHKQEGQKLFEIEHVKSLDLPQDSLIHKRKNIFHEEKQ